MNPQNFNPAPQSDDNNQQQPVVGRSDAPLNPIIQPASNDQQVPTTPIYAFPPAPQSPEAVDPAAQIPQTPNPVEADVNNSVPVMPVDSVPTESAPLQPTAYAAPDSVEPQPQPVSVPQQPQSMVNSAPASTESTFSHKKMSIVLVVLFVLVAASLAIGIGQINKKHKTTTSTPSGQNTQSVASVPKNWIVYTSTAGDYSAAFPTKPTIEPQATESESGVSYTDNSVASGNNQTAYIVAYLTYPSTAKIEDSSATLDDIVQSEKGQLDGGKVVSSSPTTLDGQNAENYQVTGTKDGNTFDITGRVTILGQVIYNVLTNNVGTTPAANYQQFLDSFKINK